jgi:hypothetical protein
VEEIVPGLFHWTTFHEGIRSDVSSYFVEGSRTLIDPRVPAEGLEWFRGRRAPERAVLTIRHHYRHCDAFARAFGIDVWCHEDGLHEFEDGPEVLGFSFGDRIASDVTALEMDAISPDDTALRVDVAGGALAFGDGLVNWRGGRVGFVPDHYMGDDPEEVKRGLRRSLERLLEEDFEHLLFAHGDPIIGSGRATLARFLESH